MATLLRNQKIRLISGQLVVLDVDQMSPNGTYTPGVAYLNDFELSLEQFDCCFNGEQWIELGIRQCLDIWSKNNFDAEEIEHISLVWDPSDCCWMADLSVDGADIGLTFSFDDEGDMHVQEVSPYMIVVG
jgi:hypothetical protein